MEKNGKEIYPLQGLDNLIIQGNETLKIISYSESNFALDIIADYTMIKRSYYALGKNEFDKWVIEVSKWLNERFPDSGLLGSWLTLGEPQAQGLFYDHNKTKAFKEIIKNRIRWLGNFNKNLPAPITHQKEVKESMNTEPSKIFIVHGKDDLAKTATARFIEQLGLTAIILHEQASSGKTIIEKIEEHTDVGFGIILYTPCDIGGLDDKNLKSRARQNVVFEHGYLLGKLGRQKVCALVKGEVEIPNDISGIVYIALDDHGAWHLSVAKELKKAGYPIDMNKMI